eukprot:354064-Chlamydomonas_euryale.AAC.14
MRKFARPVGRLGSAGRGGHRDRVHLHIAAAARAHSCSKSPLPCFLKQEVGTGDGKDALAALAAVVKRCTGCTDCYNVGGVAPGSVSCTFSPAPREGGDTCGGNAHAPAQPAGAASHVRHPACAACFPPPAWLTDCA